MPSDVTAFLNEPELRLLLILSFALLVGALAAGLGRGSRRKGFRRAPPRASNVQVLERPRRPANDSADQLRIVMNAEFTAQPLLNKSEARLFEVVAGQLAACNPRWRVMAQVSLGEILRAAEDDAFRCVNAKRVDLLLVDESFRPRHAIEYQGTGHYQRDAAARDAVKREALRRAGIGYHEVKAGETAPADVKALVSRLAGDERASA